MASTYVDIDGTNRDTHPNRALNLRDRIVASEGPYIPLPDAAISPWFPTPGATYNASNITAGRTLTITDATIPLPYNLKQGEGFSFTVYNNSAFTLTVAPGGAGSGVAAAFAVGIVAQTLTVTTGTARTFVLTRSANVANAAGGNNAFHLLYTTGSSAV